MKIKAAKRSRTGKVHDAPPQPSIETSKSQTLEDSPPPPEALLLWAQQEEKKVALWPYVETIVTLRDEKNFTFREIAEWLNNNGVPADHNSVYRIYTKGMPQPEADGAAYDDEQMERERE